MPWDRNRPRSRKYGADHAKTRAQHMAQLQRMGSGSCAETVCLHPSRLITPDMDLHLCHDRRSGTVLGLGHRRCNTSEAARYARSLQNTGQWTPHPCRLCGKHAGEGRKYCSQRCGYLANPNRPPRQRKPQVKASRPAKPDPVHSCELCGSAFTGRKRKYCKSDCQVEANARANRERYRAANGLPPTWERPRRLRSDYSTLSW